MSTETRPLTIPNVVATYMFICGVPHAIALLILLSHIEHELGQCSCPQAKGGVR